jgi:hypothetical protein
MQGPTPFCCFETNMDSHMYRRILSDYLVPFSIEKQIPNLHQDNDRKHSSQICVEILRDFEINWVNVV